MADLKISQLPAVTSTTDSDVVPIVQSGVTDKIAVSNLRTSLVFPSVNTQTANYSVLLTDRVIVCNASGAITITLPTAVGISGRMFDIKRINSSGNVTLATTSSQTIDGITTQVLTAQYDSITVISDGANWSII